MTPPTPPRGPVVYGPPTVDSGFSLQSQVLAIVLGNLVTIVILLVLYFNILLFGYYGSELIYAVLLSEALFSTREAMLKRLKSLTHDWSPRIFVINYLQSIKGMTFSMVFVLCSIFSSSFELIIGIFMGVLVSFLVLDQYSLYLFRLHHIFASDEAFISFILVFILVTSLVVFVGSFLLLALRDMSIVFDALAVYIEKNLLNDPILRERIIEILQTGRKNVDSYIKTVQQQYEGTAWMPAIQLTVSMLESISKRFETTSNIFTSAESWRLIWDDVSAFKDEVLEMGLSVFYNSTTISPRFVMVNIVDGIYTGIVLFASIFFAFFDFGVRATFFAGVLFFLVSSPKSVLQTIMESLLSVFEKAQQTKRRVNSFSSEPSELESPQPNNNNNNNNNTHVEADERAQSFKKFEDELRNTFKAVFAVPVTVAASNAVATLFIFYFLNVFASANLHASYFAALLSLFLTIFPVLSPFLSCLPWCIVSSLVDQKPWISVSLILIHYFVFGFIDSYLLSSFHNENPRKQDHFRSYLTGLSFFFGITSIGIHGIVLGPLFVSFFYTMIATVLGQYRDVLWQMNRRRSVVETPMQ